MGNTFAIRRREGLMPGKASSVMEERLRFVARLLDGEAMTDVCRDFGVSRKTGYKIFDRYKEHGLSALSDRSRRPVRYANQLPQQVESLIVRLKAEKPHWGARKIRELLVRRLGGDVRVPAKSTIHAVLDRHGLVKRGGGPRHRARGTPLSEGAMPNDLWCADFKGECGPISGPAPMRRGRFPPQSPAPGFGEKYWSLSGSPSHSLESGGGAFLTVIFGQTFAYSAFSDSHFSSPGSVSGLIASTGHSARRSRNRCIRPGG